MSEATFVKEEKNTELREIDKKIEELRVQKRAIYKASLEAPETEKLCDNWIASQLAEAGQYMEFPLLIEGLHIEPSDPIRSHGLGAKTGDWVAVRPCADEFEGKTFLGIYVGDIALGSSVHLNNTTGIVHVTEGPHNPLIYIPDRKKYVLGCGSWWGQIKGPEDLKKITDQDIQNVWYVRALKELHGGEAEREVDEEDGGS